VGSGGTLAHRLAPSGKRILLFERGDWLPREKDYWSSKAVFVDAKYRADETWHDKAGNAFYPGIQYCVGGKTKFYGAALLRLRSEDFGELRRQHGVDPTDPPASREYPYPSVIIEPRLEKMYDGLRTHGYQPFPLPVGVLLEERDGKTLPNSRCICCNTCDGFPCLVHGKSDAEVLCVRPALELPNPDPAICLTARVKRPGDLFLGDQRELRLSHDDPGAQAPYEKLLGDALVGNPALFANEQGVEAAWAALGEVLVNHDPVIAYPPGSWGPAEAAKLVPGGWDQISVERAPQSKPEASAADR
jgi:Glucose-6-phosphate dehydrogenase, C-terminal domain